MKKLISILLCLAMLLSAVALLSSCNNEEEPTDDGYAAGLTVSEETVKVDMSDYSLVFSSESSVASQTYVRDVAKQIQLKTGVAIKSARASSSTKFSGKQILVGTLKASASQQALSEIKGHGWIITYIDDDIVIAGTNQIFTNMALEYFAENYLSLEGVTKKNKNLTINSSVCMSDVATVNLASGGQYNYSFVYSDLLDDEEGWAHIIPGNHSGGASKDTVDRPVALAKSLRDNLYDALEIKNVSATITSDATAATTNEILLGVTDRPTGIAVHSELAANEYGLFVRDGKIVVAAWNDEAIEFAAELLKNAMTDAYCKDAEGNESLVLPAEYVKKGTMESTWVTDFPKPEGENIQLAGTLSSADDSLIYAYQGAGVTAAAFDAYCELLQDNGYLLVQENTIDSNKFATFKNITKNTTINVEYAAYQNSATMSSTYYLAGQYIEDFEPTLRVTSAPLSSVNLPASEILNSNAIFQGLKVTDTMLTQVDVNYTKGDKGMFYVITLEDGSFIVVDGATNNDGLDSKLWSLLQNLYKKATGEPATENDSIHIRAWIMTHEHNDHYSVFKDFLKTYGKNSLLKFDFLLANFTSETQDYNAMQPSHAVYNDLATLQKYCPTEEAFKYIKVHTGQKFYIQNVELEVLYTHQDMAPSRQHYFNDTSTIFKTTIYNTNGMGIVNESATQTFMILGDAGLIGSTFLRGMYSEETLDSDLVQVAHHGGFGCEKELYDLMSPTATFWALDAGKTENTCKEANKDQVSQEYGVGYHLMYEIEGHLYAYVADGYATTLTLTASGPLYGAADLYDANYAPDADEADDIIYDNYHVIDVYGKYGSR